MPTGRYPSDSLPAAIGGPALRALHAAGIRTLTDVSGVTEVHLLALHGVGPRAVTLLAAWLEEHGQRFRTD